MEENKPKKAIGGAREGAGRKTKADEEKVNTYFLTALKSLYSKENDDEAKVEFIKDKLLDSQRGQIFIAEHLFGKPKETIDQNVNISNFELKDVIKFKE
jgi:hypothetical protein